MSKTQDRRSLLAALEAERGGRVIVYFLSDRPGLQGEIAEDAVRTMADHLQAAGPSPRIDLYLHSAGGAMDVPLKLVHLLRQYAPRLEVLLPAKASSAATLVAIGADAIVFGRRGELGPIDPQLTLQRQDGQEPIEEQIGVEDLGAYLRFLRRRVGISDPALLAGPLTEELPCSLLGRAERTRRAIRAIATRLMHGRASAPDTAATRQIIAALAGGARLHNHAIFFDEAREIGLPVVPAEPRVEGLMWRLFESYEELCQQRTPFEPRALLGAEEERTARVVLGAIESLPLAHHLSGEVRIARRRRVPQQLNIALQVGVSPLADLPAGPGPVTPEDVDVLVDKVRQRVTSAVSDEIRRHLPTLSVDIWTEQRGWAPVAGWSAAEVRPPTRSARARGHRWRSDTAAAPRADAGAAVSVPARRRRGRAPLRPTSTKRADALRRSSSDACGAASASGR